MGENSIYKGKRNEHNCHEKSEREKHKAQTHNGTGARNNVAGSHSRADSHPRI
jgi:hypothetical protein